MIIIAVAHNHFFKIGIKKIKEFCKKPELIVDVRGIFPKNESAFSL